jgi:hypothetical protein
MSQTRPYTVDTRLTGIALAYKNREFIADAVMPRVPVSNQSFKWQLYNKPDRFTIPNTLVGRKGARNEVEFGATEVAGKVNDYGLDDVVPNDDIAAAPLGYDPLGNATELTTEILELDREARVAAVLASSANYMGTQALAGANKWSDPTSPIITQIMDWLNTPLMRPNTMVISGNVRDVMVRHPALVKAINGLSTGADSGAGIANEDAIARLFGLQRIIYSRAVYNSAKPGQAMTAGQVWGDNVSLLHLNPLANNQRGYTWGYTAQWQQRVATRLDEPKLGLRGAVRITVGESVSEIVSGTDGGYLVTAVL